jgi:uncharacterized protein YndB with AHSA1/START domain
MADPPRISVSALIPRPPAEVFAAIADPDRICRFFTRSVSGPIEPGARLTWTWPGEVSGPVSIVEVAPGERIVLDWQAHNVDYSTRVSIELLPHEVGTKITISEAGWRADEAGYASAFDHCAGWQHMLLCMKAWILHGIDLR